MVWLWAGVRDFSICYHKRTVAYTSQLQTLEHTVKGAFMSTGSSVLQFEAHHPRAGPGRPRQTWTRTIDADLRPLNIGLHTAWRRTQDSTTWKKLSYALPTTQGHATDDDDDGSSGRFLNFGVSVAFRYDKLTLQCTSSIRRALRNAHTLRPTPLVCIDILCPPPVPVL